MGKPPAPPEHKCWQPGRDPSTCQKGAPTQPFPLHHSPCLQHRIPCPQPARLSHHFSSSDTSKSTLNLTTSLGKVFAKQLAQGRSRLWHARSPSVAHAASARHPAGTEPTSSQLTKAPRLLWPPQPSPLPHTAFPPEQTYAKRSCRESQDPREASRDRNVYIQVASNSDHNSFFPRACATSSPRSSQQQTQLLPLLCPAGQALSQPAASLSPSFKVSAVTSSLPPLQIDRKLKSFSPHMALFPD